MSKGFLLGMHNPSIVVGQINSNVSQSKFKDETFLWSEDFLFYLAKYLEIKCVKLGPNS
jgi:hypothetical protein